MDAQIREYLLPQTLLRLTRDGRTAFNGYRKKLKGVFAGEK